jgi:DNA processing protein
LAVDGCTIAVLASGVDVPYPRSNAALLDDIVRAGGLILSEAPLGARPSRSRFLVRNRLIAALALGTVVVEAANRSGALNTAAWSEACSRQTMVVPGPVTSALSAGTHGLVRNRGATLVCNAAHVLEAIRGLDPSAPDRAGDAERASRRRPRDALTLDAAAVLDALPGRGERGVARLCRDTGLSMPAVLATLAELDIAGFVERGKSGWRLSADERRRIREEAAPRAPDEADRAGA